MTNAWAKAAVGLLLTLALAACASISVEDGTERVTQKMPELIYVLDFSTAHSDFQVDRAGPALTDFKKNLQLMLKTAMVADLNDRLVPAVPGRNSGGVIYKLTPAGEESVLLNFGVDGSKGTGPTGLIFGANGNLYGVTTEGGAGGEGIVYSLNRAGQETVLYSFPDSPGGYDLTTSLASDPSGNLYGVNLFGGLPGFGQGVVYRISPAGQETVLYAFEPDPDGFFASSGVVFDAAGNLYGETSLGGEYGAGTVYKITPEGVETILFSFGAQLSATGQNPEGGHGSGCGREPVWHGDRRRR